MLATVTHLLRLIPLALLTTTLSLVATPAFPGQPVSWLAEVQTPPSKPAPDAPDLPSLLQLSGNSTAGNSSNGKQTGGNSIKTVQQWEAERKKIRQRWLKYLNPWANKRPVPKYHVIHSEVIDNVVRELISYEIEPGETEEAYLLRPKRISGALPGALVFHSTVNQSIRQPAGVQGVPEKAFGLELAKRNVICLCPRNFLWPTNHKIAAKQETAKFHQKHPNSKGKARMLWDAQVALDLLLSLPGVDKESIAAVGHSLGAKEVLYLAAFDERVKVTVSSEGGIGTNFSNWDAPWYLGPEIKKFPHEHHELVSLIAPRSFLLIGGDSADGDRSWPFIQRALPIYELYTDQPRIGLYNHKQGHSVPAKAEQRIYDWLEPELWDD